MGLWGAQSRSCGEAVFVNQSSEAVATFDTGRC
jgi:hypothetical protein